MENKTTQIAKTWGEWKTAISSLVGPGLTEEILGKMAFPAAGGDFIAAARGSIGPFLTKDVLVAAGYNASVTF